MANKRNARRPVAVDLFSGAGGLSEGLLAAGFDVAVAVEKHPHPALTHAFNHPGTTVICGDITELSMRALESRIRERTGTTQVDALVAGPPCQGYSPAGKRERNDPRNSLFEFFIRAVKHFRPPIFLFENVPGMAKMNSGKAIHQIVGRLSRLGYTFGATVRKDSNGSFTWPILNAAWYGVPQQRNRLILVGWQSDLVHQPFEWPMPTHSLSESETELFYGRENHRLRQRVTVQQALSDLEFLSGGYECHCHQDRSGSKYQQARRNRGKLLFNHLATKHLPRTVNLFRRFREGGTMRMVPAKFRTGKQTMTRLSRNRSSKAVLALPDDFIHYRRHRIPTVREMARLQSFDDDFVFLGKRTSSDLSRRTDVPQYTQVGNAVPPLLAKALGSSLLTALGATSHDLRDLETRRQRHKYLLGSSAHWGYTLEPQATDDICIYDIHGDQLPLPISQIDTPVETQKAIVKWVARGSRCRPDAGTLVS